jgi:CRP-like cAMP-binding protein
MRTPPGRSAAATGAEAAADAKGRACGSNLIAFLRSDDRQCLLERLELWSGTPGEVIYEPGDSVEYAYFPLNAALASYRVSFANGADVETALIGREGALGGIVSLGRLPAFARSVVQVAGDFGRLNLKELERLKNENPRIKGLFARYADCLLAQIFQATACNATHTLEQRAAKWLLAATDRTGSPDISLTQEQLAGLLGVGRTYANRTLGRFRDEGVIATRRSRLTIVDMEKMKSLSCECNACVREHFDAVLSGVYPSEA